MERATVIRGFTKPGRPVKFSKVAEYAAIASRWEAQRRVMASGSSTPAQDEQFIVLTGMLRTAVGDLNLPLISTETNATADGFVGITDRNGFLSKDPARIVYDSWSAAYLDPDPVLEKLLQNSRANR